MTVGPARRSTAAQAVPGLNYTAINATVSPEVVAFPPAGFRSAEYRHRIGSGAARFDAAGRSLMTWGALRSAGFEVDQVQAESPAGARAAQPKFLEDGTAWITPGMTATLTAAEPAASSGPVKVVTVIDEPGRLGFVYGSMPGNSDCVERFLLVEHGPEDAVEVTLRSIWESTGRRYSPASLRADARQRRLDERIVRALHPSYAA